MLNIWLFYGAIVFSSLVLAYSLTPFVIKYATIKGITDNPQSASRKIHTQPTPLLGGLAIFISSSAVIVLVKFFNLADFSMISNNLFIAIIIAGLLISIGGFFDDKYNWSPLKQLIFPILAVFLVLLFGLRIDFLTNPLSQNYGVIKIGSVLGFLIAFVWLMSMMYATKLLDGLDGLVSGIGAIASFFIFLISLRWDSFLSVTDVWSLVLLGSLLGFLFYNWRPAKIFLGEGGSLFIGFMLAVLSILNGSKIITTLLVMVLPVLDIFLVIFQRILSGQHPFKGDRSHLHYRLLNLGWPPTRVVWFMYLLALAFGVLGVSGSSYFKMILLLSLILFIIIFSLFLKFKKGV